VAIEPVAKALAGEAGYPIGPEGFDGEGVAAAVAAVSAG
jgi:hypothetical protein